MPPPIDRTGREQASGARTGREVGARFLEFAEFENRRVLRAAYLIGATVFAGMLVGERFLFGARFSTGDLLVAGTFVLGQMAWFGWRMRRGWPPPDADERAALMIASGWMWALLSASHTLPTDNTPYLYECVLIQTVFCYFFSGLVLRRSIIAGALTGVGLPVLLVLYGGMPFEDLARVGFVILAVNGVGIAGRWWMEDNQRVQFAIHQMLRSQALTDPLTGLSNRRGLKAGLEAGLQLAHSCGQHVGIAVLDLDRFKPINDRYGHAAGDDMLCEVARRLRSVARRSTDTVARLGGDEFAVVWAARTVGDLYLLAERLQVVTESIEMTSLHDEIRLTIQTSASSGVLLVRRPHAGLPIPELMGVADRLSLMVKRVGGHGTIIREWNPPGAGLPASVGGRHANGAGNGRGTSR